MRSVALVRGRRPLRSERPGPVAESVAAGLAVKPAKSSKRYRRNRLLDERPDEVGYLLKERVFDPAILVDGLRRLSDGESIVDLSLMKQLMSRPRRPAGLAQLSDREHEVLALVAEGLSNKAIARRLVMAERAVEAHVTRLLACEPAPAKVGASFAASFDGLTHDG